MLDARGFYHLMQESIRSLHRALGRVALYPLDPDISPDKADELVDLASYNAYLSAINAATFHRRWQEAIAEERAEHAPVTPSQLLEAAVAPPLVSRVCVRCGTVGTMRNEKNELVCARCFYGDKREAA